MNSLPEELASRLSAAPDRAAAMKESLRWIIGRFRSETGTIHRLDSGRQVLQLVAEIGLPPALLEAVKLIPVGKGIAGQTVARGEPVSICNLQADAGTARPAARQTGVGGALCVPIRMEEQIVGTLGVGTVRQYEYTKDETRELEELGRLIAPHLG